MLLCVEEEGPLQLLQACWAAVLIERGSLRPGGLVVTSIDKGATILKFWGHGAWGGESIMGGLEWGDVLVA